MLEAKIYEENNGIPGKVSNYSNQHAVTFHFIQKLKFQP